jgi:hypothetical protein
MRASIVYGSSNHVPATPSPVDWLMMTAVSLILHVNGELEMELTVLYQRSAGNSEMATGWWTNGNADVLIARPFSRIWS